MHLSRRLLAAGAAVGLLAVTGVAVAQERATRTVTVPADAVVLVLPPGVQVLPPPGMAAAPAGFAGEGVAGPSPIDVMFQRMDALMQQSFPGMGDPAGLMQAMMGGLPANGSSNVMVTSFGDGTHQCTQRVVYSGNGAAPVVQTSRDACGALGGLDRAPTPAVVPAARHARQPRLIQASAHMPGWRLADAGN